MACKLQHTDGQSLMVTRSVTVNDDLTWCVHVHDKALVPIKCNALKNFPVTMNTKVALNQLLKLVDTLNICACHPDQHFFRTSVRTHIQFNRIHSASDAAWIHSAILYYYRRCGFEKKRYADKMELANGIDPYEIPRSEWQDNIDLCWLLCTSMSACT